MGQARNAAPPTRRSALRQCLLIRSHLPISRRRRGARFALRRRRGDATPSRAMSPRRTRVLLLDRAGWRTTSHLDLHHADLPARGAATSTRTVGTVSRRRTRQHRRRRRTLPIRAAFRSSGQTRMRRAPPSSSISTAAAFAMSPTSTTTERTSRSPRRPLRLVAQMRSTRARTRARVATTRLRGQRAESDLPERGTKLSVRLRR